ncbi:MAG: acyltransferase [Deltaproteobacteria bacterium]|nr:acyltransferase [Deltaproteobacteria bacterium]
MAGEGGKAPRTWLPALIGVRGYACVFVFLAHYYSLFSDSWLRSGSTVERFFGGLHGLADMGVELFFGLSGFLIYGPLVRRRRFALGKFFARRFQRIYPVFLAVLAIYLVLSVVVPAASKLPDGFGPSMVYILQNLAVMPGIFRIEPIITVSWTLSHEAAFYLAVPLLVLGLGLPRRRPTTRLAVSALVLAAVIGPLWPYVARHRYCVMFLLGVMLADAEDMMPNLFRRSWFQWIALVTVLLSAVALTTGRVWEYARFSPLLVGFPVTILLACGAKHAAGPLTRAMSWKPAVHIGPVSYSFYMIHGLVLNGLKFGVIGGLGLKSESTWLFFLFCPFAFAMSLAAAAVLYRYVEEPFSITKAKPKARIQVQAEQRELEPVSADVA